MSIQDVGGVLLQIFLLVSVCCLPMLVVALLVIQLVVQRRQGKAAQNLADEMGLKLLNPDEGPFFHWFGGAMGNRPFAIRSVTRARRNYNPDGPRNSYAVQMQIAVGVDVPAGASFNMVRAGKMSEVPADFKNGFAIDGTLPLSAKTEQALVAFAAQGYPTGISRALKYRFRPGSRNIMLFTRSDYAEKRLRQNVLPDAGAVLLHEHDNPDINSDQLLALIKELNNLADQIERDLT